MKKLMILGAMVGFSSGVLLGFVQRLPWPELLWRATVVCFASSFLFRWWGRVWLSSLERARQERMILANQNDAPPADV